MKMLILAAALATQNPTFSVDETFHPLPSNLIFNDKDVGVVVVVHADGRIECAPRWKAQHLNAQMRVIYKKLCR